MLRAQRSRIVPLMESAFFLFFGGHLVGGSAGWKIFFLTADRGMSYHENHKTAYSQLPIYPFKKQGF